MTKLSRETLQPPVDRDRRSSEARPILVGLVVSLVGAALVVSGALLLRQVAGETQAALPEWELVRAATVGGFERVSAADPQGTTQPADASGPKIQKKKKTPDFCST